MPQVSGQARDAMLINGEQISRKRLIDAGTHLDKNGDRSMPCWTPWNDGGFSL
jgi:hypothetical protein